MKRRIAVAAAVLVASAVTAPSPVGAADPFVYAALGDSFSAGSGVLPVDPSAPLQCLRSLNNYGHVIAAATDATYTDATCGGAQTKDVLGSQSPGVPPQIEALSPATDLVTVGMGGNDNGTFGSAIVQCGSLGLLSLGQGSPCADRFGSTFEDQVRALTYPALRTMLQDIQAAAPNAEIAILGYPWLLPPTQGCFLKMPVARGDVPYLRSLQATLNDVIRQAADDTGATYVDLSVVSEGHDACAPAGVRWVEPALLGTNFVHPNKLGEHQMAARAMAVLGLG